MNTNSYLCPVKGEKAHAQPGLILSVVSESLQKRPNSYTPQTFGLFSSYPEKSNTPTKSNLMPGISIQEGSTTRKNPRRHKRKIVDELYLREYLYPHNVLNAEC